MADCECLPKCPFFNDRMADKQGLAAIYKTRYCQGNSSECARHMIFQALGREQVPADLYPNDRERAHAQLRAAGK